MMPMGTIINRHSPKKTSVNELTSVNDRLKMLNTFDHATISASKNQNDSLQQTSRMMELSRTLEPGKFDKATGLVGRDATRDSEFYRNS